MWWCRLFLDGLTSGFRSPSVHRSAASSPQRKPHIEELFGRGRMDLAVVYRDEPHQRPHPTTDRHSPHEIINCTPDLRQELDIITPQLAMFRPERLLLASQLPAVNGKLEQLLAG
jgi:hypothetical protein